MLVTMKSQVSGKLNELELDISEKQWLEYHSHDRRHVQDIFPNLTPPEREFLISGTTPDEWKEMFGEGR